MASNASIPGYTLRIALAFGDTIVRESMLSTRSKITVGHAQDNTFVLPTAGSKKVLARQALVHRGELRLLEGFGGRVHLQGRAWSVDDLRTQGKTSVRLEPEDWAVLTLREGPGIRLVVQHVRAEPLPPLPRDPTGRPLLVTTALSAVAMILFLVISFLRYDPDRPEVTLDDIDPRMLRVMFNQPPDEPKPPEEEPEISDEEKEEEKARKRAGGPEGRFGEPDRTNRSNIPRNTGEDMLQQGKVGLVKELDALAQTDTMKDLLSVGGQIGGLDEGVLVIGRGSGGMSTRGSGQGGGGEGEGTIHGTGDVNVAGTGVEDRRRKVKGSDKPKEKKVEVTTGSASVKGQLSKELIDREVRRHKAQIRFCYNAQLSRYPDLSGKVVLSWIISMDGSVKSAKVKSSSLGNKDAESCMVRALQGWVFPKPEGGVVQVEYPFFFGAK